MPREVSEIMNIFADKDAKVGTSHHDRMADKGVIVNEPWLINGKYYPPYNYFNQPDDIELWWSYNYWEDPVWSGGYTWSYDRNVGTHYAGYQLNEAMWNDHEPKFREGLKRLTDVALDRGTWSTSYEKGTLTKIAREVNNLEVDLRGFVSGPDGKGGLVKQFENLNLSEDGGFKGTAAGAFGNRIYELATRLQDMYEQLNNIDAPLSEIPDKLAKELSALEEAVNDWYYDKNTKVYNILYDWYHHTTSGTQEWNPERGQFHITYTDGGTTGIVSDQDEKEGDGPTTTGILNELNRRWEEKFKGVDEAANALYEAMTDVYNTAYGKIKPFETPIGEQLSPYETTGNQGGGGGGGGGIPEDLFEDVFPEDMFDNVFPDDMFENVFPDNMFDDTFPDDMFDNMFPDDMFDNLGGPDGGGLEGPPGGGNYTPPPIPEGYSGPGGDGLGGPDNNPGNYTPPPMPQGYSGPGGDGLGGPDNNPGSNSYAPYPPPFGPGGFPNGQSGPNGGGLGGPGANSGRERQVLETDPETGLPINPETGRPFPVDPESGLPIDPETRLPVVTDPETGEVQPINPLTGEPYAPNAEPPTLETDPETGLPINPETGEPFPISSESGLPYNPEAGLPVVTDPETGEVQPIDPLTGYPEGYGQGGGNAPIPESPDFDVPGPDQADIPPEIPDPDQADLTPPPTQSTPDIPEYQGGPQNGGQGPQSSDRSTLFSGPPSGSNALPENSTGNQNSGPSGGGFGSTPGSSQDGPGPGGLGQGTGNGAGNGIGSETGNGAGAGNGMGRGMMPPMMPPMGGMGGMGGGQNNRERERTTWLSEDERVWGTAANRNSTVLGRPTPGADSKRSTQRNDFMDAGGERTRTGTSAEDAPRGGGRKRKPGVGNRGGRRQEQTGGGEGERER
ncbi:hypothetical protein [Streptomonospora arabica]|uniref:Uncharacterized protein n=1 Tax=Streptomonospora arabica TaxID=412417 RepID=A0ABV9SRS1_9ACTN